MIIRMILNSIIILSHYYLFNSLILIFLYTLLMRSFNEIGTDGAK